MVSWLTIDQGSLKGVRLSETEYLIINKGNNKITELWTILQRESQNW
jgi:hypothetical protein